MHKFQLGVVAAGRQPLRSGVGPTTRGGSARARWSAGIASLLAAVAPSRAAPRWR